MQLIKMASGTESEVEVDEAQGKASGSCSTSTTSGVRKEKRRSKVWLYFQKIKGLDGSIRGDCVECTECGKTIKTKTGNTTNLLNHLKSNTQTSMLMLRREQKKKRDEQLRGLLNTIRTRLP